MDRPLRPPLGAGTRRDRWRLVRGPRLPIIDRYVAASIVRNDLLVLLVFLTIFSFLALVEELDDLGKGRYGFADIVVFVALTTPRRALDLAAVTTLVGSVLALGRLASGGELIAMQGAGISTLRIGWAAVKPTLLLAALALLAGEFLVPSLDQAAHIRRTRAMSTIPAVRSEQGFWSRDGLRFLRVRHVTETNVLGGVEVYEFNEGGQLRLFLHADRAEIGPGRGWVLVDVIEKEIGPEGLTTRRLPRRQWESFMTRDQVDLFALPASSLPLSDLYRYIALLRASGQDPARYELALWQKVSVPLASSSMVLLAITFVFGLLRVASAGQRMMVGTMVGIAFHLADQVTSRVGLLMNLSPSVTALAPVGAVLVAALWLCRRTY